MIIPLPSPVVVFSPDTLGACCIYEYTPFWNCLLPSFQWHWPGSPPDPCFAYPPSLVGLLIPTLKYLNLDAGGSGSSSSQAQINT